MENKKGRDKCPPEWQQGLYHIFFGTDTRAGKLFDELLLVSIVLSVIVVFLDSVTSIKAEYGRWLFIAEWFFTILFTLEYALRIFTSPKSLRYIFSFYGIIDLLAILPTYLSLIIAGSQYLIVIRIFRLLRIFRILKLTRYVGASGYLWQSMLNSRHKIFVFLWMVLLIVVVMGAVMYLVEGPENGFTSIPESIYWAIVTMTTVGYGDIAPHTTLGKTIASLLMITGYSIIAVPTGIISVEMSKTSRHIHHSRECNSCHHVELDEEARYCKSCGEKLDTDTPEETERKS